ncbi:type II toxin-antitoxin system RelE/ParE family toxin [Candidatus Poribacteria bacterium]|nr:type II toxin-antitoxin system RelE/ParE family toxin [Candidatus Poribacteria bacterium]MYG06369.1 type II toxin-antitoxin system RelE/ParE family toxin [Candidatus Poribacteria bacterium]MYK24266.1 type II toxin-antitoxin system RelE/ParE family toxin [Candidatus Poribacteria bacterium]
MTQAETRLPRVVFYRERSGRVPIQSWLDGLPAEHQEKCLKAIEQLQEGGRDLRHPHVHRITAEIYELRTRYSTIRYRLFYFWYEGNVAVLTDGIAKKTSAVSQRDVQRSLNRKRQFEQNPALHTQEIDYAW